MGLVVTILGLMAISFGQIDSSSFMSMDKPSSIAWSETGFIVGLGDDGARINLANPRTKTVELFAGAFKGGEETHIAVSLGMTFPYGNVYVNKGDAIFELSEDGLSNRKFVVPSPGSNIAGLTFDIVKTWSYRLIAVTDDGSVWAIDETGQVEHITNLGSNVGPSGLMIAPPDFGDFSSDILVSLANENKIVGISNIDHSVSVLHEFQGEKPGILLHNFQRSTLYVSNHDGGEIVKIDPEVTKPYWAQVLLVTEDEQGGSHSVKFIRSTRLAVEISELASGVTNPDFAGAVFVGDAEWERSLEEPEDEVPDIDPRLIIYPLLIVVVIGIVAVIWRFRGF
ncbi:MAG: hypothetical protein QF812_01115 [Nitrososphaerales archaeon]|nr:hypothetical protein [Nitrososphaerales archaeon]